MRDEAKPAARRPRIDPRAKVRREVGENSAEDARARALAAPMRIIENPSAFVMAIPDAPGGQLSAHDRDLLGAARVLADASQSAVLAVANVSQNMLGETGADRCVEWPEGFSSQTNRPEARVACLLQIEALFKPHHVLFCDSIEGQDLALRLAAELGEWPMTHLSQVHATEVTRRMSGEKLERVAKPARVLTVAAGAAEPVMGERFEARSLASTSLPDVPVALQDLGLRQLDPHSIALEEAPFVVAAGNGVSDWRGFASLVQRLRAAPAGSRVVCDAGRIPRDRQVGTSGRTITAECYLALGISGAIQHLQGIEECARVVAINIDEHAPIVKRADLTVIGNANEIIAALLERLREPRS